MIKTMRHKLLRGDPLTTEESMYLDDLLLRQIPRMTEGINCECGHCGEQLCDLDQYPYCPYCGQRIDWGRPQWLPEKT